MKMAQGKKLSGPFIPIPVGRSNPYLLIISKIRGLIAALQASASR
jgi:hypothetical protein